ncbi:hypothetical protein Hanom_Chr12g01068751 [Helianthus anomalus]
MRPTFDPLVKLPTRPLLRYKATNKTHRLYLQSQLNPFGPFKNIGINLISTKIIPSGSSRNSYNIFN